MAGRLDAASLFNALNVPGIDPRTWVVTGRIVDDDDSVRVEDGCVVVDIVLAGLDVTENADGDGDYPETTAKWVYPSDGSGGVIFCGLPQKGHPCIVFVSNGDPDQDIIAMPMQTSDYKLPSSVLADPYSTHILAPSGSRVKIGSRGSSDTTLKKVARVDDETKIDNTTSSSLITVLSAFVTAWNATQPGGGPVLALPGVTLPTITQVLGKVSKGSSRVLAGGTSS